jgi:hypothetical protein
VEVEPAIAKLLAYCRANDWAGHDPYDALNSGIFTALPFLDSRIPRLVLTQALKRSPVNLRPLLLVPRTQNPKALALFLSALLRLRGQRRTEGVDADIEYLIERLAALRSPSQPYCCWGYSFPWQTRTVVVPAGAPNLVCTCFVANALLDAWKAGGDARCLEMVSSAAAYLTDELYWENGDSAGFSYPMPSVRVPVHNANLLAAALLCRMYAHTREDRFLAPALRVARYSAGRQRPDGSWYYGEAPSQRWIDNFHTGYNLCALDSITRYAETAEFAAHLRRGFTFYRANFFREDGVVKYFHNRTYPIDIHCVAQSIITLATFSSADNLAMAQTVLAWALKHMWQERGFFYYRVLRPCTVRISYMRWSQAWMLLAMVTLLDESRCRGIGESERRLAEVAGGAHD